MRFSSIFSKQALHAMGHTCHTYLTGAQLLHSLQSECFDLLIVDWHLPDTTGPEVVRWVRQHVGLEMPILFVPHRQEERDIVEGLGCGADDFMTKPVRIGELRARVPVRNRPWARRGDFLERRINAVEAASRQLRDLHQFVSNSLQQLPAPNFVCDAQGRILLANVAAQRHVGLGPFEPQSALQGKSIFQVLQDLQDAHTLQPLLSPDKLLAGEIPAQSEGHDAKGRSLLMLCKPFTEFANVGWLITLVDMTEIRRALQQRDQALHFISHDIRAPNASILTLLEMQRNSMEPLQADELLKRIEKYAQASLSMAESFVRLASAQSNEYRVAPLDLASVLQDAVDDAWTQASNQEVSVTILQIPHSAPCVGDRPLLARAMANVLNNAIKYSPARGTVRCSLYARGTNWVISIHDEGPGIDPAQQDRLFKPFSRLHDLTHPNISGVGLGLALVHTVVKRHGGSLELESAVGQGAEFRLVLPASASD